MSELKPGRLYVVPTPVGNLQDITLRGLETLRQVDEILAEDTRQTKKLLDHFGIRKPMYPYHKFNERASVQGVLHKLQAGMKIGLVSDGGTPGISDPGAILIQQCLEAGITVETLPGATAFVPALVNSGFDTGQFVFIGFLPHKKGRQTKLRQLAADSRTQILYESPYRVVKLLEELRQVLSPGRRVSFSREISKFFEESRRGTPEDLLTYFATKEPKGEFVIIIEEEPLTRKEQSDSLDLSS